MLSVVAVTRVLSFLSCGFRLSIYDKECPSERINRRACVIIVLIHKRGLFFYLTGNYNKLYNSLLTKLDYTNCIIAVTSVK